MDVYSAGQRDLKIALEGIAEQISKQASAITVLSGGLAHEQSEVTKLLKAFDRFSTLGKWALSGNNPVEANINALQREVGAQTSKLEIGLGKGFESVVKTLKELTLRLEQRGGHSVAAPAVVPPAGAVPPGGVPAGLVTTASAPPPPANLTGTMKAK